MTTIKRVSSKELRKLRTAGKIEDAPPPGISPVLRASWRFAQDTAKRFNKELAKDRVKEFLKKLAQKFV